MNKKNFPIFISVFIVSLFLTIVFYFAKVNLDANYREARANNYADAIIDDKLSKSETNKLEKLDGISYLARKNPQILSAKLGEDILAIYMQDEKLNEMRKYSWIEEGDFPKNSKEIMLSKSLVEKHKLKLGDELSIDFGQRIVDENIINPTNSKLKEEDFNKIDKKTYTLVGIYEDVYNKYAGLSYGLIYDNSKKALPAMIKFDDFSLAYENKEKMEDKISQVLNRDIKLKFDDDLISYYRVEEDLWRELMAKSVLIFSAFLIIVIFIFFVRNIFWVWGIRKIKELSIYKSIGSTDFQIYKHLFKEASIISLLPLILGHICGFMLIFFLYEYASKNLEISKFEYVTFSPILSSIILLLSLIIIMISIIKPARKISKINIIDGIRGNIDLSKSKKKRNKNIWKELRLNNISSIKSQRYISAIGVLIISFFVLTISIGNYFRDYYDYDDGYNTLVYYFSPKREVPGVLKEIEDDISNNKSLIYKDKNIEVKNNLTLSDEAKAYNLDEKIKNYFENNNSESFDGNLIAMNLDDLKKLGGNKGDFILYNKVQANPQDPISKANMVEFFENPQSLDITIDDYDTNIEISRQIESTGEFNIRPYPFVINIITDYDSYFKLMDKAWDNKYMNHPYTLKMAVSDKDLSDAKEYIENKLRDSIGVDEKFNVLIKDEIKKQEASSVEHLIYIVIAIGLIVFILNVTNGYSSINISLMNRKKEIGSLYSAGIEKSDLKNKYEKDFIIEQVKSFLIVILVSFIVMFIISILSQNLDLFTLIKYYNYKVFLAFSLLVYGINYLIYHYSLKRILDRPIIDLIKTI